MKKILSIDCETNGLWGHVFAVAMTVTDETGREVDSFARKCVDESVNNPWVCENVIPALTDIDQEAVHRDLLEKAARFYMAHKEGTVVIAHCPAPVEARFFEALHSEGIIGDWDAPFPLLGIEGLLDAANEPLTEATGYMKKHSLPIPPGSPHNPLYDCRVATAMYRHLKGW